jgi:hypothetical protein
MTDRTANDLRMSMNDLCDEIFNGRCEPYMTCPPIRYFEEPCVCRECDAPIPTSLVRNRIRDLMDEAVDLIASYTSTP